MISEINGGAGCGGAGRWRGFDEGLFSRGYGTAQVMVGCGKGVGEVFCGLSKELRAEDDGFGQHDLDALVELGVGSRTGWPKRDQCPQRG